MAWTTHKKLNDIYARNHSDLNIIVMSYYRHFISNNQPFDCLINALFKPDTKALFVRGIQQWSVVFLTKNQWCTKRFHAVRLYAGWISHRTVPESLHIWKYSSHKKAIQIFVFFFKKLQTNTTMHTWTFGISIFLHFWWEHINLRLSTIIIFLVY